MSDTADKLIAHAQERLSDPGWEHGPTWEVVNDLVAALVREQETSQELRKEMGKRAAELARILLDAHDGIDAERERADRAEADARRYREALAEIERIPTWDLGDSAAHAQIIADMQRIARAALGAGDDET